MSAADHLNSDQYVTLYRGLREVTHPDELNLDAIGPHWTPNKETAEDFARGYIPKGGSERDRYGSVLTARVHRRHLLSDYDKQETYPGFDKYSMQSGDPIYAALNPTDRDSKHEMETFVRPQRRIHITNMETLPGSPIEDQWEFTPPLKANSEKDYAVGVEKLDNGEKVIEHWYQGSN